LQILKSPDPAVTCLIFQMKIHYIRAIDRLQLLPLSILLQSN